jgi:CubicO group peptidase (beta-lactamase class C family)
LWRILAIGSGYKAKVLASIIFGTGRAIDPQRAEEVSADSYQLMRLFRVRVDVARQAVTASFLGLQPRTASFRPGLGATLAGPATRLKTDQSVETIDRKIPIVQHVGGAAPPATSRHRPADPWPEGKASAALETVVESAFTEPDRSRRLRRTRAIVVVQDGRIIAERYAPGFRAETRLPGWSMTKSVLGALIGVLVGEGRLCLDECALLPEWHAPDPRALITVEDLLRMRSGLQFSEVYDDFSSDVVEMLFHRADTAGYAASRPLSFPPGSTWSYSSGTTNILSAIARRVVGEADYPTWPRRALFEPIGMTSALMEPDASGTFVGSSFMLATARDWARLGQLYLQDGAWEGCPVLPAGWVGFSTSPTPQSPDGMYGAHWWLKLKPELGGATSAAAQIAADAFFAVGHEGQTLTVIPSLRLVVVRLGLSIYIDTWNHAAFIAQLQAAL